MQKITSRENAKLKLARKIRDGHEKSLIFVEGTRLAEEVLRSNIEIKDVFVAEHFTQNERTTRLISELQNKCSISEVSDSLFQSIADTKNSQGIILICVKPQNDKMAFEAEFSVRDNKLPILILLHEINNPSNLGAILRTAEAVDVGGIIVTKNSADVYSPKSIRAAMGSGFRLNLWTNADFDEVLEWSEINGFISTAADVAARNNYDEIDWQKPRLLVFGSEANGLDPKDFRKIKESLIIPMANGVESLNLAVSCGIILFEAKRQQKNIA